MEIRFTKIIDEGVRKYQITKIEGVPTYKDCPDAYKEATNIIYADESNHEFITHIQENPVL